MDPDLETIGQCITEMGDTMCQLMKLLQGD